MNIITIRLLFFALTLSLPSLYANNHEKIVILGDSVTDGYGVTKDKAYPALLQKLIKKQYSLIDIVPSAISGSVTASAHNRLLWLLKNEKNIKGVMVVLGGNDLLRGMKPQTMEKGYDKLIKVATDAKIPVLLATMPIPQNYEAYRPDLEKIFKKYERHPQVTLLTEFFKGIFGVPALNQTDGIHPNELGHELIVKNIKDDVLKWIKNIKKK